ncbi:MAG: hypothetical protein ABEJ07_04835 [Candidatus Nanohaloarchaea archaeon]
MPLLPAIGTDATAVVLFLLLVASFVIAFKVMQMVFETILVSVLSGLFYVGMVYFFGYPMNLERVLLFAFLGATLYMAYSFIVSAYSVASTVLEVPYHILRPVVLIPWRGGKKAYLHLRRRYRLYRMQQGTKDEGDEQDEESGDDVKEVVLDKVRKD